MSQLSRDIVIDALKAVIDLDDGQDVVAAGRISGVAIRGTEVGFLISIALADKDRKEVLRKQCEQAVAALSGVTKVTAVLTAEAEPDRTSQATKAGSAVWNKTPVEGVKNVIVVASGKGGVGKSTATVCLAYAFADAGLKVGILDADIYGPSIPTMLGLSGQPEFADNKMLPHEKRGIQCMSIGFVLGDEAAILRGPMITKALHQMLRLVQWGKPNEPLDVLLVDMPPGTGDVHLSMAQQVPITGAVVVTTPQQVATIDAKKAVQMFRKVNIPIFGIIENMSHFVDPKSGNTTYIFGKGGGDKLAREMSTLFLGEIPIEPALGEAVDHGALLRAPDPFKNIAALLSQQLHIRNKAVS